MPRPSSPVHAKASTNCPYLTLESPHHLINYLPLSLPTFIHHNNQHPTTSILPTPTLPHHHQPSTIDHRTKITDPLLSFDPSSDSHPTTASSVIQLPSTIPHSTGDPACGLSAELRPSRSMKIHYFVKYMHTYSYSYGVSTASARWSKSTGRTTSGTRIGAQIA